MYRWLLVAGLLLSVSSSLSDPPAVATPGHPGRVVTWRVQSLPVGRSFSEPGVAAGRRGVLFASACTANANRPASFWRSRDGGKRWTHAFAVGSASAACGDADTAIGSDGYEYAAILGSGVEIYRSRTGRTWSAKASFPFPHGSDQPDRPWIVTVPRHPNVVHVFNSEGGGDIVEWTSTDHAATFSGPVLVTGGLNSQAVITLAGRPLVDPAQPSRMEQFYETAGLAGLVPAVGGGGVAQFPFSQLWRASSTDGGRTWHSQQVIDVSSAFGAASGTLGHLLPASAIDRTGRSYVVLSVQLGTSAATHLYLLHSTASGGWSPPVRVDRAGASNVYPAVAVRRPGKVYVSWYGASAPSFDSDSARWHEMVAVTSDGLAAKPLFVTQRVGPLAHAGAIEQAGAVGFDLRENWSLRDFQSIAVDSCGRPHPMWASDYRTSGRVFTASLPGECPG